MIELPYAMMGELYGNGDSLNEVAQRLRLAGHTILEAPEKRVLVISNRLHQDSDSPVPARACTSISVSIETFREGRWYSMGCGWPEVQDRYQSPPVSFTDPDGYALEDVETTRWMLEKYLSHESHRLAIVGSGNLNVRNPHLESRIIGEQDTDVLWAIARQYFHSQTSSPTLESDSLFAQRGEFRLRPGVRVLRSGAAGMTIDDYAAAPIQLAVEANRFFS
jgi:hypothetical protein